MKWHDVGWDDPRDVVDRRSVLRLFERLRKPLTNHQNFQQSLFDSSRMSPLNRTLNKKTHANWFLLSTDTVSSLKSGDNNSRKSTNWQCSVKTSSFCSLVCVVSWISSSVFHFVNDASSPFRILSPIVVAPEPSTLEALLVELRRHDETCPHCMEVPSPLSSNWTYSERRCVFGDRCVAWTIEYEVMLEYVPVQPFIESRNSTTFALSKASAIVIELPSFVDILRHQMEIANLAEFLYCIRFQRSEFPVYYLKDFGEAHGARIPDWTDSGLHKGKQSIQELAIGGLLFLVLVCVNALANLIRLPELCLETEDNKVKPSVLEASTWTEIPNFENNLFKEAVHKTQNSGPLNHLLQRSGLPSSTTIPAIYKRRAFKDLSNVNCFESLYKSPGLNKRSRLKFDNLQFLEPIGSGCFKTVYRGLWRGFEVAIARMKEGGGGGPLQEARLLQSIPPHPNIIKFHNWTTDHEGTEYAAMDFMSMGDLSTVLRRQSRNLCLSQKIEICVQICQAMQHLTSHNILHRDLAARNILVKSLFPIAVKVADFGFAKIISKDTSSDLKFKTNSSCLGLVPVRWISPEIIHSHCWSEKSEVWAFGVTMWEIFSNGHEPFAADFSSDFEVADYVLHRGHLSKPQNCPYFIFNVMCQCWKYDPSARPTFDDLTQQFLSFQSSYESLDQETDFKAPVEVVCESSRSRLRSYAHIEEVF